MADFTLNSQVRVLARIKDVNGQLVAGATVTITFTRPDASTTSPSVTNDSVGIYHSDVTLNQAGTWTVAESSTGVVTAGSLTFTVA
jgi:Bacterial Ig-like domain (group 1)/YtkA-like